MDSVRNLIKSVDSVLRQWAGNDNLILHNFFRCVTITVLIAIPTIIVIVTASLDLSQKSKRNPSTSSQEEQQASNTTNTRPSSEPVRKYRVVKDDSYESTTKAWVRLYVVIQDGVTEDSVRQLLDQLYNTHCAGALCHGAYFNGGLGQFLTTPSFQISSNCSWVMLCFTLTLPRYWLSEVDK